MTVTDYQDVLESLPGPAWIVDAFQLQVEARNHSAEAISLSGEFSSLFAHPLDERVLRLLRSAEAEVQFQAALKDQPGRWVISANLLGSSQVRAAGRRLVLAQPVARFDVPGEITFDELLDSSFDGMAVLNSQHKFVQISRRFREMFGYTLEELRGKTPLALTPQGLEEEIDEAIGRLDRGGVHSLQTKRRRRDGMLIEVEVFGRHIASGRYRGGLVLMYRDISESNRNARLRAMRNEVARILTSASTLEEVGRRLLPALADALGWDVVRLWLEDDAGAMECFYSHNGPGCECANRNTAGVQCILNPGTVGRALLREGAHFQPPESCAGQLDCPMLDGVQLAVPIQDGKGQSLGALEFLSAHRPVEESTHRELLENISVQLGHFITRARAEKALEENEARFQSLVESVPMAILIIQDDGRILFANSVCESISGYTREELCAYPVWQFFHPEDTARLRERGEMRQAGQEFDRRHEARILRKGGEVRWLDYVVSDIHFNHRPALLCAGLDITDQRALEMQLRQTQKMEAIGRLSGGIAHDFNNVLTVISCCAETIQMHSEAEAEVLRAAGEISQASDRAAALTRQLLSFSRHHAIARMRIDLNAVLAGMEMILRRSLGDDILLALEMEAKLGPVLADASQVEQVVLNLAVNARDAMPRGGNLRIRSRGVVLENSSVAGAAAGSYAVLSVSDSGVGMSQEIQQHIFEPFFTTKQPGKGTGLGLATVYGIVKQCGGFVKVTSQPGQGSTFEVYFPVNAGPVHGGASGEEKDSSLGETTILLVEDESDLRDLLQAGLVREGYRVLEAASAAEALQASAAHHGQLDLLVTDVVLGGMSGRELAERLLMLRPGLKVLFISGHSGAHVLEGGEIEGRMEFLQKPFAPSVLRRRVHQMLSTE